MEKISDLKMYFTLGNFLILASVFALGWLCGLLSFAISLIKFAH